MRVHLAVRKALMDGTRGFGDKRVGIALSGGVDSCSVLAALLRNGVRPTVLSYTPDTHESTDHMYAQNNARLLGLPFRSVPVAMDAGSLTTLARRVIGLGYKTKMQVESLTPMVRIAEVARIAGIEVLFTGDQADGYYINNNWMSRNYDRSQGIPGPERKPVSQDKTPDRIDRLREMYYQEDRANTEAITKLCALEGVSAAMPYRSPRLYNAFLGSLWLEVNVPRLKEPTWQAFPDMSAFTDRDIWVRPQPVNLHRGDSNFALVMGRELMARYPGPWKTTTGLYSAMARGQA